MLIDALSTIVSAFFDRSPAFNNSRQIELENQFIQGINDIEHHLAETGFIPKTAWENNILNLFTEVREGDPRKFLRWPVIQNTMSVQNSDYAFKELRFLQSLKDWRSRWRPALVEIGTGRPQHFLFYPLTSENTIHHLYHFARLEQATGVSINCYDVIAEVGGGYGNMCRLAHRLGFEGSYLLYDIPAFSQLQQYYLKSAGVLCTKKHEPFNNLEPGVSFYNNLDDFLVALRGISKKPRSLFLATWSISEFPVLSRQAVLDYSLDFSQIFLAFQERFRNIDNRKFFSRWMLNNPDRSPQLIPIPHLPKNHYLLMTNTGLSPKGAVPTRSEQSG